MNTKSLFKMKFSLDVSNYSGSQKLFLADFFTKKVVREPCCFLFIAHSDFLNKDPLKVSTP